MKELLLNKKGSTEKKFADKEKNIKNVYIEISDKISFNYFKTLNERKDVFAKYERKYNTISRKCEFAIDYLKSQTGIYSVN